MGEESTEVVGVVKYLMSCLIMWQLVFHVSDAAITALAKIVQQFMYLLGNVINSERLKNSTSVIPRTYKSLLNLVGKVALYHTSYVLSVIVFMTMTHAMNIRMVRKYQKNVDM